MNTSTSTLRNLRIVALAAGMVGVAGAAVLVTASASGYPIGFHPAGSPQPAVAGTNAALDQASAGSAVCTDFISHLSSDLGKSPSEVNAAIQKAVGQTLADQVKSGKLTQKQADAITARLAAQPPCSLPGAIGNKPATPLPAQPGAYLQMLESAAASALGITPAQLRTDLAGGMTLSQIAAAQHPAVDEATFRARLIARLKPELDAAVTAKRLTQVQEDRILLALKNGPIPFWSRPLGRPAAVPSPASA
ncbi:MAG TPA: hypothetical protein VEW68_06640 [Patescibacteria group bacterium]|nr:hypothetical protein [Patescibacteria group bacterium]